LHADVEATYGSISFPLAALIAASVRVAALELAARIVRQSIAALPEFWSGRRESNPRHTAWEAGVLR
jgi:hypothetical protein